MGLEKQQAMGPSRAGSKRWAYGGPDRRFERARELAYAYDSVRPVVLPRVSSSYILYGLRAGAPQISGVFSTQTMIFGVLFGHV